MDVYTTMRYLLDNRIIREREELVSVEKINF
jgi:hypothetical protein